MDKETASDFVNKLKETLHPTGEPHFQENQPQQPVPDSTSKPSEHRQPRRRNSDTSGIAQKVKSLIEGASSSSSPKKHKAKEQPSTTQRNLDPRDASHVPPSVLAKHVGAPSIEHAYPEDSSTRRHSSASHQEAHYNLG